MKHTITTYIIAAILLGGSISGAEAATTLSFGGIGLPAVRVEASTTDLHGVYVIDNAMGTAKASYEAEASANIVQVQRYGAEGIAYASDVTGVQRDGTTYTWTVGPEDCGFVVNDGGRPRGSGGELCRACAAGGKTRRRGSCPSAPCSRPQSAEATARGSRPSPADTRTGVPIPSAE